MTQPNTRSKEARRFTYVPNDRDAEAIADQIDEWISESVNTRQALYLTTQGALKGFTEADPGFNEDETSVEELNANADLYEVIIRKVEQTL